MRRIPRKIRRSFENITPNVLPAVLSKCEKEKENIVHIHEPKRLPLGLRVLASAAALVLLVGIGFQLGGLFSRPSMQNPPLSQPQPDLVYPEDALILQAFCNATDTNYYSVKDTATIRHYWHYDNIYFFYVDGLQEYSYTLLSRNINDMEFLFESTQPLYIYKDGICAEFLSRNESLQLLNSDILQAFYIYHQEQNPNIYAPEKTPLDCPAHLTSEKRAELEAVLGFDQYDTDRLWYSKNDSSGVRYYGTYEGYDILFQAEQLQVANIQTIAQQAFAHNCSFALYAHKDGELLNLSDVYESGLISKDSIIAAREYHNQCYKLEMVATCRPHVIMRHQEETIESVWNQISDEPFGTWYSEETPDGNWRVYAGDILFYDGGQQEDEFTTITIGDYSFSHNKTFRLYILAPETLTLMDLSENPDAIINESDLKEAYEQHTQVQNAIFGENWQAQYEHDFENTVLREPTCSDPGEGINVCKDCGYTVSCDYPLKEHMYEHWAHEFATCQNTGVNKVTCRVCGDSYLEETPKTDHRWDNKHTCNSLVKCEYCDALHDPMHEAPVYGTSMEPTADRAGLQKNYCQWCRENFYEIWGNTGDYMLYVIQFKAAQYAESLGFTYEEAFPQTPYKEYEYMELYSVVESNGGQDALLQKAYELIDQLYDDACNSTAGSTAPYTIWISIMYLTDKNYSIGAFQIHAFIA